MEKNNQVWEAVNWLADRTNLQPEAGIVLGSGFSQIVDRIETIDSWRYEEIPHFPRIDGRTVSGKLYLANLEGHTVAVLSKRLHYYQGYDIRETVFPIRLLCGWNIRLLILTNAAGGIREDLRPGDLMVIADHLNLMGVNPLRGETDADEMKTFTDMQGIYTPEWIEIALSLSRKGKRGITKGVYAAVSGPSYETPAEVGMLKTLGADAVGMSTVPEAIVARKLGIPVAGISCITNRAAGYSGRPLSHSEVLQTARSAQEDLFGILNRLIGNL